MTKLDEVVERVWHECVASQYVYRGMSINDISDPLSPGSNPYADAMPMFMDCFEFLQRVVDSGFQFTIVETHWGRVWRHELKNIVNWSRRDLKHPRLDFTSSYDAAREYSDNWQGSQLKQNMKYIAEHLPRHRDDPVLKQVGDLDWALLERVGHWVSNSHEKHVPVVLWLRRSHPALRSMAKCAPVGALPDFRNRILGELDLRGLPHDKASVRDVMPQEFDAYLAEPLWQKEIERIEEVAGSI